MTVARILVVEDDPDVALLVSTRLRRASHEVSTASDGQAGLDAVRSERPDLVVLDWMMPRLTGIQVCQAIREDPDVAHTRVVLLTARAQDQDMAAAYAAGVDDYILKPFDAKDLVARVDALLTA